jgi:succinate dehydrogenase / fumarate reductase flavoprotein subunit
MTEYCGVFRSQEVMKAGLLKLQEIKAKYEQIYLDDKHPAWNTELIEALELRSIMVVGEMILTSALNRQESRGSHAREDFTDRNDSQFLQHTLAAYAEKGIEIDYMPVVINRFEPQERKY